MCISVWTFSGWESRSDLHQIRKGGHNSQSLYWDLFPILRSQGATLSFEMPGSNIVIFSSNIVIFSCGVWCTWVVDTQSEQYSACMKGEPWLAEACQHCTFLASEVFLSLSVEVWIDHETSKLRISIEPWKALSLSLPLLSERERETSTSLTLLERLLRYMQTLWALTASLSNSSSPHIQLDVRAAAPKSPIVVGIAAIMVAVLSS